MGDKIEIEIFSCEPLISELHETVTSLINQLAISKFQVFIKINGFKDTSIDLEIQRLKKAGFKYGESRSARFYLSLRSGDVLSSSFLYKAVEYLKFNTAGFVCPEFTFKRVSFQPFIATISNNSLPLSAVEAALIDREKASASPLSAVVKDTCLGGQNIENCIYKYLKSQPKEVSLSGPFLNSKLETAHAKSPRRAFCLKSYLRKLSGRSKVLKRLFPSEKDCSRPLTNAHYVKNNIYISNQLRSELASISNFKFALKGYDRMQFADITPDIAKPYQKLFWNYQRLNSALKPHYDYIMVLPWLISGGIDLFAINYLHALTKINKNQNILVFLTNNFHKSFTKEELGLPDNIDFVNLPEFFGQTTDLDLLMEEIIHSAVNAFQPKHLHIIASKVGYNVVIKHGDAFRKNGINLIFSSYNYLVGPHHEYMGYTVEELPRAYRPGDTVTTDNSKSKSLWVNQYGFNADDILIHNQLFEEPQSISLPSAKNAKILWAAHVRPEKNPSILPAIASALAEDDVEIDCYGLFTKDNWESGENPLETSLPNLHYKGAYSDFFNDIDLNKYNLFLYTSHTDGTPNVILEAALAGLPIISSDIGGISEATRGKATLIKDTHSAEDFISAIRQVLSHYDQAKKDSAALKKELITIHGEKSFIEQTKAMLNRSKNV